MPHQPVAPEAAQLNRALSPFETVFWRLAQAGTLDVTMIAAVHGPLSEDTLAAGLRSLRRRHPFLQVRICNTDGPTRYVSTEVSDVPLRIVNRDADDCEPIVEEEINNPIDAERGPLARCTWVRHDDSTHHLLITFHHIIGDGMSGVFLMRDLVQATAAQPSGSTQLPRGSQQIAPPLHDNQPMDLRLPYRARGLRGVWRQVRLVAGITFDDLRLRPPARPAADQQAPLHARRTRLICRTFDPVTVNQLLRKAREQDTTVHGALSAAICLATAKDNVNTEAMSVKHRCPVNMRQHLDPQVSEDVGMFASMAFYRGRVKSGDDFWALAREIRSSIKHQIDHDMPAVLIGMLPRLDRMIRGDRLTVDEFGARWQKHTPSTTGLTNLGRVELAGDFAPLEVRSLHFAVSPGGLGDCTCTATTYAGSLRWNFLYASPLFNAERANRITEDTVERLKRAIAD
ncbi:MAG: condensation domain-containing protein [Pirellulaceae bacterium]|nr:condensation domain-containing protein [Pirellulaceae bacterium]MDP6554942.1 condensation domain-containing protein [Pirellulaceae bacterium]